MKQHIDWHYMKPSLITVSILILLATVIAVFSWLYLLEYEEEFTIQHQEMVEANSRLFEVMNDKRLFEIYGEQYQVLVERGVVGGEQRLEWVDAVKAKVEQLKLPELLYKIGPQKEVEMPGFEPSENLIVTQSRIELTFGIYHTEDLIDLLGEIRAQIAGIFNVESCRLTRIEKSFSFFKGNTNMKAVCTLNWFTLRQRILSEENL